MGLTKIGLTSAPPHHVSCALPDRIRSQLDLFIPA